MRHAQVAFVLGLALLLGATVSAQAQPAAKPSGPAFEAVDADRNGRLTLDEVLAYAKKKGSEVQPFSITHADLDGDGKLGLDEQRKAGIKGLEQFGAVNLKEMDINGDGYISREDLDEFFRRKHREAYARADADKDQMLRPSEFALFRF